MNNSDAPIIKNIPSSNYTPVGYRTVTSSADQNLQQENMLNDILDLFNKANKTEKSLNETLEIIDFDNKYSQIKINSLESKMANLLQKNIDSRLNDDMRTINIYPQDTFTNYSTIGANIDLQYSDITLQSSLSIYKTSIYDEITGTTFIPPSLEVIVNDITDIPTANEGEEEGIIKSIVDNDVKNPFNRDPTSYWIRKVITNNQVENITCEIIITLPEDIITTRDINQIAISPYPSNSVDIMALQYKQDNGLWVTIPDFLEHAGSKTDAYRNEFENHDSYNYLPCSPNVKFNFKEITGNQLKIILRQRNYISLNDEEKLFCLGAKEIEITNNRYNRAYDVFSFDVDFAKYMPSDPAYPDDTTKKLNKIVTVHGLEIVYNNPNTVTNNTLQVEYNYYDMNNVAHKMTETLPFTIPFKKILVKCKMYKGNACPNINTLKIKYKLS